MKKDSKQSPKTKPKKRSSNDKVITLHVPVDAYTSLKKLAVDNSMTINALFNFYIQQIVNQEADEVAVLADPRNLLVDSGRQEQISIVKNLGVKYEKFDISSTSFVYIYFKSFVLAMVICIVVVPVAYLVQHLIASVIIPIFLSLIWGVVRIIASSITRKEGSRLLVSGIGWFVGTLSAVILGVWLFLLYNLFNQTFLKGPRLLFLILLFGIVFVGLLVNAPIEINNLYIKRRAKQINEHRVEWGEEVCQAVVNREIQPDMPKEMVLLAWGHPTIIENQEVIKDLFTERWVYKASPKSFYVWFTNGKINKINDSGV